MLGVLSLLALALLAPTVDAHSPGAHVHGAVTVNLALEGNLLVAELEAPALHVVGFEKAPRNTAERTAVDEADRWLASGREFLAVPGSAGCRWVKSEHSSPDFRADHVDYRVRTTYRCAQAATLPWVELWMLRRLKGVEKVEVNLILPSGQRQITLTPDTLRIALR